MNMYEREYIIDDDDEDCDFELLWNWFVFIRE
jgi:hypothetical protein